MKGGTVSILKNEKFVSNLDNPQKALLIEFFNASRSSQTSHEWETHSGAPTLSVKVIL